MNVIQRIWKDPVGANVIAGLILLAAGWASATLSGLSWDHPVRIQLWLLVIWGVLSGVAMLYTIRALATFKPKLMIGELEIEFSQAEKKFVAERLSEQLELRYDFVTRPGESPRTGQAVWQVKYIEALRLLGPKLLAGADEVSVKNYLDQAIKDGSAGKLNSVHVVAADFQSMKVRLEDIGVITLTPNQGKMQWALTSEALRLLPKLH
jgi:hypothetical protein